MQHKISYQRCATMWFVILRSLVIWLALLITAVANGGVREAWLVPALGNAAAHIVSSMILSGAILLITKGTIWWIAPKSRRQSMAIGFLWVGLTLSFEFLGGHYLFGHPWSRLLADYDVAAGRIWILVLITTALAPRLTARFADRRKTR
jgi:hypothetical protein